MRLAAIALFCVLVSCDVSTDPKPSSPPAQLTGLPRDLTADEVRASSAANQFALTLFHQLNAVQPTENVFVSPLSVSFSLGMAMNGATGATFNEMRSTLGFGADDIAAINAGYKGILSLESGLDASTTFSIANSVWYRQTLPVMSSFADAMHQTFSADVKSSPFDASTISAVNNWVLQKTAGKIPTILAAIDSSDVMFLVNAIYFKGSWRDRFDAAQTTTGGFAAPDGLQQVSMMHRSTGTGQLRLRETNDLTVGELSYGNGGFVMTIAVPTGDVNAFTATLDTATWRALLPTNTTSADVVLPKFSLDYEHELKADLQALGMLTPFNGDLADFSAMSPVGDQLVIGFVKHKTFVKVDEEGTEAAAVTNTGIVFPTSAASPCLCVTRPFIFAIRERFSGTILFMGKVVRVPQ